VQTLYCGGLNNEIICSLRERDMSASPTRYTFGTICCTRYVLASLERVLPLRGIARPRSGHIVSRLRDISYLYIALRSNISCAPQGAVPLI